VPSNICDGSVISAVRAKKAAARNAARLPCGITDGLLWGLRIAPVFPHLAISARFRSLDPGWALLHQLLP
jgi:hypothetical protein